MRSSGGDRCFGAIFGSAAIARFFFACGGGEALGFSLAIAARLCPVAPVVKRAGERLRLRSFGAVSRPLLAPRSRLLDGDAPRRPRRRSLRSGLRSQRGDLSSDEDRSLEEYRPDDALRAKAALVQGCASDSTLAHAMRIPRALPRFLSLCVSLCVCSNSHDMVPDGSKHAHERKPTCGRASSCISVI